MWWHKKKKVTNPEVETIEQIIEKKKTYEKSVYVGITDEAFSAVAAWCSTQGYSIRLDHVTDNVKYYKISGWD